MTPGTSPGKVLFFGEHSVIYGWPGFAASIDLCCHVKVEDSDYFDVSSNVALSNSQKQFVETIVDHTFDYAHRKRKDVRVKIKSEIPLSSGLGSSSATVSALVKALSKTFGLNFTLNDLVTLTQWADGKAHGNPSGIDANVVNRGGFIMFQRGVTTPKYFEPFTITLVDSGERTGTKEMIKKVAKRKEEYQNIFNRMGQLCEEGVSALESGCFEEFGRLLYEHHSCMKELSISTSTIDKIVEIARSEGLPGAKLTGAGGGGLVLIVGDHRKIFEEKGYKTISARCGVPSLL